MQNLDLGKQQSTQISISKNGVSTPLMTRKPTQDKNTSQKPEKEKPKDK